jgi:hypothetical protein
MNFFSLPRSFFLDKVFAVCNSDSTFASFSMPLLSHLVFILPLHHDANPIRSTGRLTAPPVTPAKPDHPLLGKTVGRCHLDCPPLSPLVISIPSSTEALTFGRRGAHFREKYARIVAHIQVEIQVKRVRNLAFTALIHWADRGAHFRENYRSLSGEVNTQNLFDINTFWIIDLS